MKLYQALAGAFRDEGVSRVFGLMGDANMFWMNAMHSLGVDLVDVRHEGVGLAMADGWAQVSGRTGVCTTTSGPGTTQLATSLVVASRARTPIVAFCGGANTGDIDAVQGYDQGAFAAACEAGFVRVESADRAYEAVARAFYRARTECRPIMLSAAQDLQQEPFDDTEEYVPAASLLNAAPVPADLSAVAHAADIIANSSRPVIIVGRGARGAEAAVQSLACRSGALVSTTLLAKNVLAEDEFNVGISGLFSTRSAMELFSEADCVIAVGASLNHYTTEHGYLFPEARFVQIDVRHDLYMGNNRRADCFVLADARLGVEAIEAALTARGVNQVGFRTPEVKARLAEQFTDPGEYDIPEGTIDPRVACRVIDDLLPPEIGLVIGSGHQSHFATMLFRRPRANTFINKYFGCIGQGIGTAMGATIATNRIPTVLVEGDASFMMHAGEFDTAVRYGLPLLIIVANDEYLGAEYHKSETKGLDPSLARVPSADLGQVGRAFGGRGWLVRSVPEIEAAIGDFLDNPGPAIIDLRIAPTVLSIPYRRLWHGDPTV
jgi:acetolactate synthase-1/2/3 large subunit